MKTIGRVLLIICDTSWMHAHLAASWRMTGATVFVEHFGSTMGRDWDVGGERENRERNARWRNVASEIAAGGGLDLVFFVALDDVLEDQTLIRFRQLGAKSCCPCTTWTCWRNGTARFGRAGSWI